MGQTFEFVREPFQAQDPVGEADLAAWEAERGVRLPEDYRRFLLRTNGGFLRPFAFELTIEDDAVPGAVHALDHLFDWKQVSRQTQEDIAAHLRTTPPGWLAVGITEGELFVMLSLEAQTYGSVALWVSDYSTPWGQPPNDRIHSLASSFEAFLDMLRPSTTLYHGYWREHDRNGDEAERVRLP